MELRFISTIFLSSMMKYVIDRLTFQTQVKNYLRYMIVEHSDLVRDLNYWETLSVSSLMLRPVKLKLVNHRTDRGDS